jgi:hypothetical protein
MLSFARWIAGLASEGSPPPDVEREAGELVTPERFDPRLHEVGERWNCWALRGESPEAHRHRLELHLTTLQIAIEDDLKVLGSYRGSHA